jgi:uncharacterized protein
MFRKNDDYTDEMAEELNGKLAQFYERIRGKKIIIGFTAGLKSYILVELARPVVAEMKCIFIETSYTSPQDLLYINEFMKSEENSDMETEIIQSLDLNQNILILNSDERDFFCKKGIADLLEEKRVSAKFDLILDGTDSKSYQEFWNGKQQFGENYFMIGGLGITRDDIVYLSKKHGFKYKRHPEINLLSRFAYKIPVTEELLKTVIELEKFIQDLTNISLLRVRVLDKQHVIIEVRQKELSRLLDEKTRKKIFSKFNEKGFNSINIDLAGYRMNNLLLPSKSSR